MSFKKVILNSDRQFGSKTRALLQNLISQYIKIGGFPEIQTFDDELRRDVLRNYLDVVILRDVIERHSITKTLPLRALMRHIMSAPATRFSVNKFYMMGDRGALLENLVYMHFRRQGLVPEYYVTKNGAEVDFVLPAKDRGEYRLIQVCWDIHDPNTQKREVSALLSAMDELGLKRGTIVTWLDEDVSDKRLEIVPAWKWLLAE